MTGNASLQAFVKDHMSTLGGMAYVLVDAPPSGVMYSIGLTGANNICDTMDNLETWRGLHEYAALNGLLGNTSTQTYYDNWAASVKSATEAHLWNSANNTWDWTIGKNSSGQWVATTSNVSTFYPDAAVQIWAKGGFQSAAVQHVVLGIPPAKVGSPHSCPRHLAIETCFEPAVGTSPAKVRPAAYGGWCNRMESPFGR